MAAAAWEPMAEEEIRRACGRVGNGDLCLASDGEPFLGPGSALQFPSALGGYSRQLGGVVLRLNSN